jgi:hypothetical protein
VAGSTSSKASREVSDVIGARELNHTSGISRQIRGGSDWPVPAWQVSRCDRHLILRSNLRLPDLGCNLPPNANNFPPHSLPVHSPLSIANRSQQNSREYRVGPSYIEQHVGIPARTCETVVRPSLLQIRGRADVQARERQGLEHTRHRVFNDAAFQNGAGVLLARVPWKGHNFQDAVYYMLDNPDSSMGIYPLTLPVK